MPKILKILTVPKAGKHLRKLAANVEAGTISTPQFKRLVQDMERTMLAKDGIGLAAPQVGVPYRLALINSKDGPICLINPVITKKSILTEVGEEGCFSVPNFYGMVKRYKTVTCNYTDIDGKQKSLEAKGLMARGVQHELDHLDGVLFIDKLEPKK
jgi:peptide deformylase